MNGTGALSACIQGRRRLALDQHGFASLTTLFVRFMQVFVFDCQCGCVPQASQGRKCSVSERVPFTLRHLCLHPNPQALKWGSFELFFLLQRKEHSSNIILQPNNDRPGKKRTIAITINDKRQNISGSCEALSSTDPCHNYVQQHADG